MGCEWKGGFYVIPNWRSYESLASKFSTLYELHEWYPEPEATRDPVKVKRVEDERRKQIMRGVVSSRRSQGNASAQVSKQQVPVVEKQKRKAQPSIDFAIGDKVKASFKKSRAKYPGTVVSIGNKTYAIQFDDGDYDQNVPKNKIKLISGACIDVDTAADNVSAPTTIITDSIDEECCVCKNTCTGAHTCASCKKICHAICGESTEEGFGGSVTCLNCLHQTEKALPVVDEVKPRKSSSSKKKRKQRNG